MADYARGAFVQTDVEQIGTGTGDLPGTTDTAICIAGLRPHDENGNNWTALTPECARELYELLDVLRHIMPPKDVSRRAATARLRQREADAEEARVALRAAWAAEIRALPVIEHVANFDGARDAMVATIGPREPETVPAKEWVDVTGQRVVCWFPTPRDGHLWLSEDDEVLQVGAAHECRAQSEQWPLTGPDAVTLDAAVKGALCWLAERDVFPLETPR